MRYLAICLGCLAFLVLGNAEQKLKADGRMSAYLQLGFVREVGRLNEKLDLGLGFVGDPLLRNFQVSIATNTFWAFSEITNHSNHYLIQLHQGSLELFEDYKNRFVPGEENFKKWCGKEPKFSAEDALKAARTMLQDLDLTEETLRLRPPTVELIKKEGAGEKPACTVPFYSARWEDSKGDSVVIQVSGITGKVTTYSNGSSFLALKDLPKGYSKELERISTTR